MIKQASVKEFTALHSERTRDTYIAPFHKTRKVVGDTVASYHRIHHHVQLLLREVVGLHIDATANQPGTPPISNTWYAIDQLEVSQTCIWLGNENELWLKKKSIHPRSTARDRFASETLSSQGHLVGLGSAHSTSLALADCSQLQNSFL